MATDPAGVEAVPGEMLSLTNTVHVITWPTATDEGAHVTTVDVARVPTVTVLLVARPLLLWTPSLAEQIELAIGLRVLVGVSGAVHLESVALKDTHVPENAPRGVAEPPLLNETVSTGVDSRAAAPSLTSAVHVTC